MISLNKLQANIWFLGLLFYPLTFFMYKFDAFNLSFFKILVIISTLIHLYSQCVLKKIYLNKYIIIFGVIFLFSLIINSTDTRIILNSVSYLFILVFSIIGMSVLRKVELETVSKNFKKVIIIWFFLLLLGFVQLLLSYFGFDFSWESIGEPSLENKGDFLGRFLIRPASLYGEPREFSAHILLVYFLYCYICKKRKVNIIHLIIFTFLGIATQSSTFIIVFLFSVLAILRVSFFKILFAAVFLFFSFDFLLSILKVAIPRLMINEQFSIDLINTPAFAEQAGDLSFFIYIYYTDLFQFLIGNGMGMSNTVIATITNYFIDTKTEFDFINSRWLFYTLLIDFGLIGIIYFIHLVKKNLPNEVSFLTLSLLSIITSLFTGSYLFVFVIIILNSLSGSNEYLKLNQMLEK